MSVLINLHGSSKSMTNSCFVFFCFFSAKPACLDVFKIDHLSGGKEREKPIGPHNTPFDLKYEASGKHCTKYKHPNVAWSLCARYSWAQRMCACVSLHCAFSHLSLLNRLHIYCPRPLEVYHPQFLNSRVWVALFCCALSNRVLNYLSPPPSIQALR